MILRIPAATTAERTSITPAASELIYDETLKQIFIGDGTTTGGLAIESGSSAITVESSGGTIEIVTVSGGTFNVEVSDYISRSEVASVTGDLVTNFSGALTSINEAITNEENARISGDSALYTIIQDISATPLDQPGSFGGFLIMTETVANTVVAQYNSGGEVIALGDNSTLGTLKLSVAKRDYDGYVNAVLITADQTEVKNDLKLSTIATSGNILTTDANGVVVDSGVAIASISGGGGDFTAADAAEMSGKLMPIGGVTLPDDFMLTTDNGPFWVEKASGLVRVPSLAITKNAGYGGVIGPDFVNFSPSTSGVVEAGKGAGLNWTLWVNYDDASRLYIGNERVATSSDIAGSTNCLPLSGGTMTGKIISTPGNVSGLSINQVVTDEIAAQPTVTISSTNNQQPSISITRDTSGFGVYLGSNSMFGISQEAAPGGQLMLLQINEEGSVTNSGINVADITGSSGGSYVPLPSGSNVAFGEAALDSVTTGGNNVAVGRDALTAAEDAGSAVAVGDQALMKLKSGYNNTALGAFALVEMSGGNGNTALGASAMITLTNGQYNTSVGQQSLNNNVNGSRNVALGFRAGYFETGDDKLYVANSAGTSADALLYGDFVTGELFTVGKRIATTDDITSSSVYGIQGRVPCTSASSYTISHAPIDTSINFPVVSLEVSGANSDIFVKGIYNRTSTSFDVVLGGQPDSTAAVIYHIGTGVSATDNAAIHIAGSQTITGVKTFDANIILSTNNSVCISADNVYGWDDILTDLTVKGSGASNPTFSAWQNGIYAPEFATNVMNECWSNIHLPHTYAPSSGLHLHVHWSPANTSTGVVRWGFEYTVAKRTGDFPATTTAYVETNVASNSQYKHFVSETSIITNANFEPDTLILVRVFRDANHANDTFGGTVHGFSIDCHYQKSRWATKNKDPNFYN